MAHSFYSSKEYREKQSSIMKKKWSIGVFNSPYSREQRKCCRKECGKLFEVIKSDPKVYCGQSCFAIVNNHSRGGPPAEVRLKISNSLKGRLTPRNSYGWIHQPKSFDLKSQNLHPDVELKLILKEEYLNLEKTYSGFIKNWEFKNSRFENQS